MSILRDGELVRGEGLANGQRDDPGVVGRDLGSIRLHLLVQRIGTSQRIAVVVQEEGDLRWAQ